MPTSGNEVFMQWIRITPTYTLFLRFDIRPGMHESCYQFVQGELANAMQDKSFYLYQAWHILYGPYPAWQVEFVTEKLEYVRDLLGSSAWARLEDRLQGYTQNYSRRILPFNGLQV